MTRTFWPLSRLNASQDAPFALASADLQRKRRHVSCCVEPIRPLPQRAGLTLEARMNTKTLRAVYWSLTGLFCLLQGWAALQYLIEAPRMMQSIHALGYPTYFVKLLGVAKLLGIAAILYGGFPRLKEWAYAGFTIDTVSAFFSHVSAGDSLLIAAVPLLFCAVQLASYFLWKRLTPVSDTSSSHRWAALRGGSPPSRPHTA
jgi:uncharacterized membrane protein YphA (DoxX/SURF4 family)